MKTLPITASKFEEIAKEFGTPFYLYDESAIVQNVKELNSAMSDLPNYKEYFAVKALPNPTIMKILANNNCAMDCSSLPELLLCEKIGVTGSSIMFTSNQTPAEEYIKANELGAIINLDDISHIEFLEDTLGKLPETLSFRFNPGGDTIGNAIIGSPKEAKYGLTKDQLFDAYKIAQSKGVKHFGLHTMIASNELQLEHHKIVADLIFELAVEIHKKLGIALDFINLGGGVGIPYLPTEDKIQWSDLAKVYTDSYNAILRPAGLDAIKIKTEYGRPITGPYGYLVTKAIHYKNTYKNYIGVDASMADLMRPGIYGAYHHITVIGKEQVPATKTYDIVGSLCENSDKFAINRQLPEIHIGASDGDLLAIHDAGAHSIAMGFNYNGKLRPKELLLKPDGSVVMIRRAETIKDYFATLNF
jgi:diaminopimelate decarboxylase